MKNKYVYRLWILMLLSITTSCNNENDILEPDAEITFGIRHDKSLTEYEQIVSSANPELPDFSSVVAFDYSLDGSDNGGYIASGVVIGEQWILTAGHNFYDAQEQNSPAPISGIIVKVGNDPNSPDATYTVSEIIYHPTWRAGDQDYQHANDLCLVKVSTPIGGLTPASLYEQSDEEINSIAWHSGFGDYTRLAGQNPDLQSKKHAMENRLDRVQDGLKHL